MHKVKLIGRSATCTWTLLSLNPGRFFLQFPGGTVGALPMIHHLWKYTVKDFDKKKFHLYKNWKFRRSTIWGCARSSLSRKGCKECSLSYAPLFELAPAQPKLCAPNSKCFWMKYNLLICHYGTYCTYATKACT